jgi:serine/threonine-protein kinase
LPGLPEVPLRVEAASYRGKPVAFGIIGPWSIPERDTPLTRRPGVSVAQIVGAVIFLSVLAGGAFFARRNVRLGRGDRRSALKIVLFTLTAMALAWVFAEHHVPTLWELRLFVMFAGLALFVGGLLWLFYIAVEPYVRRRWPHTLITWTRLVSGEFRDPLVGRDILVGASGGVASFVLQGSAQVLAGTIDAATPISLNGIAPAISQFCAAASNAVLMVLLVLFLVFFFRLITRNDKATIAAVTLILSLQTSVQMIAAGNGIALPFLVAFYLLAVLLLMRFGLLCLYIAILVTMTLSGFPITLQSAWFSGLGFAALAVVLAITLYGFRICLGSRPLVDLAAIED